MWSTTISGAAGICESSGPNCTGDLSTFGFNNPNISIQYRAFVTNADTGDIILPGSAVPVGTHLQLVFDKHVSDDIYWFATGAFLDSPYGDWGNPDVAPPVQCLEKDYLATSKWLYYSANGGDYSYKNYVPFIVREPVKNISGNGSDLLSCDAQNGSEQDCTATAVGTVPLSFNFGTTVGKFYVRYTSIGTDVAKYAPEQAHGECGGFRGTLQIRPGAYWAGQTEWRAGSWQAFLGDGAGMSDQVDVGTESIPYPIRIVPATAGPSAPVISGGACTTGTPYPISFTSTDPNGHKLKYGIDWDADGTVDQYVPPSGYVNSGVMQGAYRSYSLAGQKQVRVVAVNDQGAISAWSTHTFTCQCNLAPRCSGNDLVDSCTGATIQSCSYGCRSGACYVVPAPSAALKAIPSLVHSGDTTIVSWSALNVASCTLSGTNGNSWTGTSSSGKTSSPIQAQTIYTLHCIGNPGAQPPSVDKSVTVNLIPSFNEK